MHKSLIRKHQGKILLGIYKHRRKDNIRMHLRELVSDIVDWIYLVEDRDQW